jgi:hypothetical protein
MDASDAGEAWSDNQITAARDSSVDTVARTRQLLVEKGCEAALKRKRSPASARPRIFDGAADTKLITLACSEPLKGRAWWALKLLEEVVVELKIIACIKPTCCSTWPFSQPAAGVQAVGSTR